MSDLEIRFDDGAAYERMMGVWTRLAGDVFLDWLAPVPGLRWLDVGCGNGAFTQRLVERWAPVEVEGIDPSEAQLAYARTRPATSDVTYRQGNAMALPHEAASFDAAVMALVIFFVPEPAKGVAEMARVVRPGGSVSAYAWDVLGGGLPAAPLQDEMRALGISPPLPPRAEASRFADLRALWSGAGLERIETREIVVSRRFDDFEDFWTTSLLGPPLGQVVATMTSEHVERLKARLRARMTADATGGIAYSARVHAIKGVVPKK